MKAWHVIVALLVGAALMFFVRPYINFASTSSSAPSIISNQSSGAGDWQKINQSLLTLTENQNTLTKTLDDTVKKINSLPLKNCEDVKNCFASGRQPAPAKHHSSGNGSSHESSSSSSNHTDLTVTVTCNGGPCNGGTSAPPPPPRVEEQPRRKDEAQSDPGPIVAKKDDSVTVVVRNRRVDY